MAEEASNVVNNTEVADTSSTESTADQTQTSEEGSLESIFEQELNSPEHEEKEETTDASDESADDTEETSDQEEETEQSDDTEDADDTESEPQYSKAEQRKEQLNAEIRQMVESKRQLEQELQQMQQYQQQPPQQDQPLTEDQLLDEVNPATGEYYTQTEAQVELLKQELQSMQQQTQVQQYQAQVQHAQAQLASEVESSLKDYPMFDSQSKQYDKQLADRAEKFIKASLVQDNNGQIVGTNMPVRDILATIADIRTSSATVGEANARKATNKMMANADTLGGSSKATTGNPEQDFIDNFFKD